MKILKLAQPFSNEGIDPLESPEAESFLMEQEWKKEERGEKGKAHTSDIIEDISKSGVFDEKMNSYFVSNGTVGWFRYSDGKIYEVLVTPLTHGQHKNLFE